MKFRPGVNTMQNYTTLQFGITDWFSLGTDLSVGKDYSDQDLYARGGNHNYEHWLYLGSNIVFNDKHSLFPMIGIVHDWKFQQPVDLAVGAWYTYKNYSFYL